MKAHNPIEDVSVTLDVRAGHTVVAVCGEIDAYTAPQLREQLVRAIAGGARNLVIDLLQVEFMDSTAIGVLVGAQRRLREQDGSLYLVSTREPIAKLLRLTGLDQVFPPYPDTAAALAALTTATVAGTSSTRG